MPITLYCDEHFGTGDATRIAQEGAACGLHGIVAELFLTRHRGQDDPFQLLFAAQNGWIILTKDRDFQRLHELWHVMALWRPAVVGTTLTCR
jgi:hypothetical protein